VPGDGLPFRLDSLTLGRSFASALFALLRCVSLAGLAARETSALSGPRPEVSPIAAILHFIRTTTLPFARPFSR
jgi:hypothetical protein